MMGNGNTATETTQFIFNKTNQFQIFLAGQLKGGLDAFHLRDWNVHSTNRACGI